MTEVDLHNAQHNLADLYEAHRTHVYRYVYGRCGDHELAQDITQDVFVIVARQPNTEVNIGWLFTVARNRMVDVLRRRRIHYEKAPVLAATLHNAESASHSIDNTNMVAAVEQLRANHRTALLLHYVEGYKIAEIAELLGRSPKGVEALITRARKALREALEGGGY